MKEFIAVVYRQKKCPKSDVTDPLMDPGIFERVDCGCVYTFECGRYDTLAVARLVAARQSKLPGRRDGVGKNTGLWNVETEVDGVIAAN